MLFATYIIEYFTDFSHSNKNIEYERLRQDNKVFCKLPCSELQINGTTTNTEIAYEIKSHDLRVLNFAKYVGEHKFRNLYPNLLPTKLSSVVSD